MRKHLFWAVPLVFLAALFIAAPYGTITLPVANESPDTNGSSQDLPQAYATVEYAGEEGEAAFALLQQEHDVKYTQYDFGVLVNSIDGQEATSDRFWLFYVNGQQPTSGADTYMTHDGDTILWRLEQSTM